MLFIFINYNYCNWWCCCCLHAFNRMKRIYRDRQKKFCGRGGMYATSIEAHTHSGIRTHNTAKNMNVRQIVIDFQSGFSISAPSWHTQLDWISIFLSADTSDTDADFLHNENYKYSSFLPPPIISHCSYRITQKMEIVTKTIITRREFGK